MQDISLHLLDIIENCAQAKAKNIDVNITINKKDNALTLEVKDNGYGMDAETLYNAQQPFFTTKVSRKKKIGLGIPLFKQNAEQCNGYFSMSSEVDKGTTLTASFQLDHIDRMPLGNISDTILTCILGHPEIDYQISYLLVTESQKEEFEFNTTDLREELGDIPLDYPDVIGFIREQLDEGINGLYFEEF